MKVLVCDDSKVRSKEVKDAIGDAKGAGIELVELVEDELTKCLTSLFDNVNACFDDPKNRAAGDKLPFDDADLVILDNNLAQLHIKGTRLTAESIAGYVRAFTAAPYVISLNKNPDVDFDLRYLVGDYETRADFALNTKHLANPALWTGKRDDAKNGFLPWYWPRLLNIAARRREQIAFVRDHLGVAVITALGFPTDALDFLSLHAKGALSSSVVFDNDGSDSVPFDKLTFCDVFLARSRSLPDQEERKRLSDEARGGNAAVCQIISRIVAADIDLWFRRDVLGPQDALVDVPHLLMRMPFLLGKRAGEADHWNKAISENAAPFGIDEGIFTEHLTKAKFEHDIWAPNPSFWWSNLKANGKLDELFFQKKEIEWPNIVFCEDRSLFLERSPNEGTAAPVEFAAEFEGSWGRRYVARIEGIRYAPRTRLAT